MPEARTTPLLEIQGLTAGYGLGQILNGLSLAVPEGRCVALLGRNGMGKTTTIRSIMGQLVPRAGRIRWRGQAIGGLAPYRIARLGLGWVPEGREIFPNLTVRENLVATARAGPRGLRAWTLDRVYGLLPRLAERSRHYGNQLSGGEQQMLAIGRALMTNPELLALDEATEGLSPLLRQEIWTVLERIKAQGMTILIVDKHLLPLLRLADHHYIIEKGTLAWQGSSDQLRRDADAQRRFLSA